MDETPTSAAWFNAPGSTPIAIMDGTTLGRDPSNSVVLASRDVSRHHARIDVRNQYEFWLTDLNSKNGTYVNGRRLMHPVQLESGNEVVLGDCCFTFRASCSRAVGRAEADEKNEEYLTVTRHKTIECWLLVADMERSVSLSQSLPHEQHQKLIGQWLGNCSKIIETREGEVNKFLGDGLLAFWRNRPEIEKGVATGFGELREYQNRKDPCFRVILHYGMVGLSPNLALREDGLSGKEVNFIFRMEKLASSLGRSVLLSEAVAVRLGKLLDLKEVGRLELPSFPGQHLFYTV